MVGHKTNHSLRASSATTTHVKCWKKLKELDIATNSIIGTSLRACPNYNFMYRLLLMHRDVQLIQLKPEGGIYSRRVDMY